jgi:hypothetical protein
MMCQDGLIFSLGVQVVATPEDGDTGSGPPHRAPHMLVGMVPTSNVRSGMPHSTKPAAEPAATGLASMHFPTLLVDHHFASSFPRERQSDSLGVLSARIVAELPVGSFFLDHPITTVIGDDADVGAVHPSSLVTENFT